MLKHIGKIFKILSKSPTTVRL